MLSYKIDFSTFFYFLKGQLREEYAEMVDRIEELADFKDEETQQ